MPTAQIDGSVTILRISDIKPYENNPRHAANPLFDTIKVSIRQRGMEAPLKVTRRPGAMHYVVAAGGNTRLLAQLQLWQETADPLFETVPVVIKAWHSESDVLAGHLIENEQRSDLTFWDKARGMVALKTELDQERAAVLSLRQWESALLEIGLQVGKDVLSTYLFAVERLSPLGPVVSTLSRNDVRDQIQPCFRCLGRLAQKFGLGEPALYADCLNQVMQGFAENYETAQSFDARELAQASNIALAKILQISVPALQTMLALLDRSPESTLTELRIHVARAIVETPIPTVLIAKPPSSRDVNGNTDGGPVSRGDRQGANGDAEVSTAPRIAVSPGDSRRGRDDVGMTDPSAAALDAFKLVVHGFARTTQCADCLRWQEALPLKFYVEIPTAPLDLEPASPLRHAGWWLLAFLSGQFDPGLTQLLPDDSPWRRMLGAEAELGDERMQVLIQTELGGSLAPDTLVAWLTRTSDPVGATALECLQLARSAWAATARTTPASALAAIAP